MITRPIIAPTPRHPPGTVLRHIKQWEEDLLQQVGPTKRSESTSSNVSTGSERTLVEEITFAINDPSKTRLDWLVLKHDNATAYRALLFCKEACHHTSVTSIFPPRSISVLYFILRDGLCLYNEVYSHEKLTSIPHIKADYPRALFDVITTSRSNNIRGFSRHFLYSGPNVNALTYGFLRQKNCEVANMERSEWWLENLRFMYVNCDGEQQVPYQKLGNNVYKRAVIYIVRAAYRNNVLLSRELRALKCIPLYFFKYTAVLLVLSIKKAGGTKDKCSGRDFECSDSGLHFDLEWKFATLDQDPEYIKCSKEWFGEAVNDLVPKEASQIIVEGEKE